MTEPDVIDSICPEDPRGATLWLMTRPETVKAMMLEVPPACVFWTEDGGMYQVKGYTEPCEEWPKGAVVAYVLPSMEYEEMMRAFHGPQVRVTLDRIVRLAWPDHPEYFSPEKLKALFEAN